MRAKGKSYLSLIIWVISLVAIGAAIGASTETSVDTWYHALNRSPLTPPSYVFSIVWTILYILIAISGWIIWKSQFFLELPTIKKLYIAQMLLNWSWTPLFFGHHLVSFALICLCLIVILVAILIVKSHKNLPAISGLLIPYLLWLTLATHLNFYIWQNNIL